MQQSQPETILAELVVNWLESQKWDVYQEVQIRTYGPVADIVAVLGNLVWIIECKKPLSLSVMEQAYRWRRYSNFVSVAVQRRKGTGGRVFATQVLETFNIGVLAVDLKCPLANKISEIMRPAPLWCRVNGSIMHISMGSKKCDKRRLCEKRRTINKAVSN